MKRRVRGRRRRRQQGTGHRETVRVCVCERESVCGESELLFCTERWCSPALKFSLSLVYERERNKESERDGACEKWS